MRVIITLIAILFLCNIALGVPSPTATRSNTYTAGNTIDPNENNANENEIFNQYNTHTHNDTTSTTSTTWTIGADTDVDHDFIANNGDANNPLIRYDSGTNRWQIANDGTTFVNIPTTSGAGVDAVVTGLELRYEDPDAVTVQAGAFELNDEVFRVASSSVITIASGNDWIGGATGSGQSDDASTWIYVYAFDDGTGGNVASFSFSLLAPNSTNEDANLGGGVAKYRTITAVDYRCIGAVRNDSGGDILKWRQNKDTIMWDIPIVITSATSNSAWSNPTDCSPAMSTLTEYGIFGLSSVEAGGAQAEVLIKPNKGVWTTNGANANLVNGGGGSTTMGGQRLSATDTNQQIQYQTGSADDTISVTIEGYKLNIL